MIIYEIHVGFICCIVLFFLVLRPLFKDFNRHLSDSTPHGEILHRYIWLCPLVIVKVQDLADVQE